MKIEGYQGSNGYNNQINKKQQFHEENIQAAKETKTAPKITLSENTKKIREAADTETGVDLEKVSKLKDAIKNGTYQISADKIADKMLGLSDIQKED
ncbi:flagellar biosynthesis anti-sigma factor FlgM [Liquorilactobacillus oeni]|uniref:Negative regulator of flagellin synthesis n=2 Tax=Liquorilactobacillus oeni TaxID=303241 RepID=A0A0R1MLQ4_9LACO|nr:flagellar biosynthesis anti-sigma factor FlgM [Liquorilactobacillus oeni]AJA34177.1 negative regulator of flagellin synthesis FlgM [Liquorilactobacillus oeni]KRL05483.1 hypothetical protein FD46_GL000900 [Liquorilactobacillus oeni DSM 19972]